MYALTAFAAADAPSEPDRSPDRQGATDTRGNGATAGQADGR
jgi:hypothetical protein